MENPVGITVVDTPPPWQLWVAVSATMHTKQTDNFAFFMVAAALFLILMGWLLANMNSNMCLCVCYIVLLLVPISNIIKRLYFLIIKYNNNIVLEY